MENEPQVPNASHRKNVEDFVLSVGGAAVAHPGGDLASHLRRVADKLQNWGVRREIVDAGHLHAAYGTDGFGYAVMGADARLELVDLVGVEAEALISLYCRCHRDASYPSWATATPIVVDRYTGETVAISEAQREALIVITVANEIDVLSHDPKLLRRHGNILVKIFGRWRPWLCPTALKELDEWILWCRAAL